MAEKMMPDATAILDFVPSLADTLLGHGMTLGIVSSGRRWRISRVLRREGLDGQFKVIVGVEDVETPKPDPSGLLRAVDALNTPKEHCFYVGDSVTDAETARRAGLPLLPCCRGYGMRGVCRIPAGDGVEECGGTADCTGIQHRQSIKKVSRLRGGGGNLPMPTVE